MNAAKIIYAMKTVAIVAGAYVFLIGAIVASIALVVLVVRVSNKLFDAVL